MKFMLCVIDTESNSGSPEELKAINAFNDGLQQSNQLLMAEGIQHPRNSVLFDNRLGAGRVSDGPLHELEEYVSGFWIISAKDTDEARQITLAASKACNRKVELRPLFG
jgi:hypothetical protein